MSEHNLSQLKQLEAESIRIFRDAVSQFDKPILLYSIGKDSSVLVRLAQKAFYPGKIPFKLLHINSTWKFKEMLQFRDDFCAREGLDLIVHHNKEGKAEGVNPFDYGSRKYTDIMKTQALLQALDKGKYDVAFGGARRDEEKSRAKERIYSFRDRHHQWDPKNQRPELWSLYNGKINSGESVRVFPLSNWTETEIWDYVLKHDVPYNKLHDKVFLSIGCACCTRAVAPGEHIRSGRWWWEAPEQKECGLHAVNGKLVRKKIKQNN